MANAKGSKTKTKTLTTPRPAKQGTATTARVKKPTTPVSAKRESVKKATVKETQLTLPVYNKKGEEVDKVSLPNEIFGQKENQALITQAIRVYLAKQKPTLASTKTRSQVRGGGRKPWRQKGTGRARAGTIRAPHWRGGGVVFGPSPKLSTLVLPKKMRQKALAVALSDKYSEKALVIIDKIDFKEPRTKLAVEMLAQTPLKTKRNILVVLNSEGTAAVKSLRNIENITLTKTLDLNALFVLKCSGLIFTLGSLEKLKERFLGKGVKTDVAGPAGLPPTPMSSSGKAGLRALERGPRARHPR